MNIAETFKAEWPKIREFPANFFTALIVLGLLITGLEYVFFKERLAGKDDTIQSLKEKLSGQKASLCTDPTATRAVAPTGSATASGDGSIANTGNESTFGAVPKKERSKKPKK